MSSWPARPTTSRKVVLITGAARGIGAETARRLRARGANVALVGLEPELLEPRAARAGRPRRALARPTSATPTRCSAAVDATVERFGGIDVVHRQRRHRHRRHRRRDRPEDFERVIDVNLLGVWRTVRAALPHVVARRGYILPIASMAAAHTPADDGAVHDRKAGVEAFADCAADGGRPHGDEGRLRLLQLHRHRHGARRLRDSPAAALTRRAGPRFMTAPIPLSAAGDAIVRAASGARAITYAPRWSGVADQAPRDRAAAGRTRDARAAQGPRGGDRGGAGGRAGRGRRADRHAGRSALRGRRPLVTRAQRPRAAPWPGRRACRPGSPSRRPVMTRRTNARLWTSSSRRPVSSRFLSR